MREGIRELIKYRLQRADETLEEARLLFKEGKYAGAINRLYYACFYAVLSLLLTKELRSSKHSGVLALFNREFVKAGLFPKEEAKIFNELFNLRLEEDYKDFYTSPDREELQRLVEGAEIFIKRASDLALKQLAPGEAGRESQ